MLHDMISKRDKTRAKAIVEFIFIGYYLKKIWNTLKLNKHHIYPILKLILSTIGINLCPIHVFFITNSKSKMVTIY